MSVLCGHCRDSLPSPELLYSVDWWPESVCGACKHGAEVDKARASQDAAAASLALALEGTWESEVGKLFKAQRVAKLEASRWTIDRDSPLSVDCQNAWLAYRALLNRMTVDHTIATWKWPTEPAQLFA